jgi:hypothetical protein
MRGLMPLRYLLPGLLLMLTVACGGGPETSSPTVAATGSEPTETPISPISEFSAAQWQLRGLTTLRQFPPELEAESIPLPAHEVEALWTRFLGGTRWVDNASSLELFDLCSDETGMHLDFWEGSVYHGEPFTWTIEHALQDRWNAVEILNVANDPALNPSSRPLSILLERDNGVFLAPTGNFIAEGGTMLFFESPSCD